MQQFTINIPCKKYIKAYLENNCGTPVDLKYLPDLLRQFNTCLQRKSEHRNLQLKKTYPEMVTVVIPSDSFYRFGWELNNENILDFNKVIEQKVKFFMRQYISLNFGLGVPLTECISNFQSIHGFNDEIWNSESIRRDYYRHRPKYERAILKRLRGQLNKILLDDLSQNVTISQKYKKEVIYG